MRLVLAVTVALASPTPGERAALVAALRSLQGDVAVQTVGVSRADRRFASVRWGFRVAQTDTLFQLRAGRWRVVFSRATDRPADGACAFVPAAVVRELLGVGCPGAAALHARPATGAELQGIAGAFRTSPLTRYWRDAQRLTNVCISRVDRGWAAAHAKFADTSGVIWFRRAGAWTVAHETPFGGGAIPPPRIVLSLAACVGYNAAEYGG